MNKEFNYFNEDLYKKIYDIGSFRAFCDLKRNQSSIFDKISVSDTLKDYYDDYKILKENTVKKYYDDYKEGTVCYKEEYFSPAYEEYKTVEYKDSRQDSILEDSLPDNNKIFREQTINRLFSLNGLTYKFNRGLIMVDNTGKMVEDIFDGTSKHHASEITEVSLNEFGVDVPFLGIAMDFREAVDASNKGLTTILLEGNIAQIYLPDDVSNEMLDEIINEVSVRDDFIFFIVRDKYATDELLKEEVVDYLESLYVKEDVEEEVMDKLTVDEYINELLTYTIRKRISIYDYFLELARCYLYGKTDSILEFEKRSPFINNDDIRQLIECNDLNIDDYFASTMNRVILLNLIKENAKDDERIYKLFDNLDKDTDLDKDKNELNDNQDNDIKDSKDLNDIDSNLDDVDKDYDKDNLFDILNSDNDENENKDTDEDNLYDILNNDSNVSDNDEEDIDEEDIRTAVNEILGDSVNVEVTSINLDVLNTIDGFVLINEKTQGVVSVYGFDASNPDELKGRTTFENVEGNIESGFYINFMEFEKDFREQYGDAEITFVSEDGEELDYNVVMDTALELSRSGGAIRFGVEYKDEEINNKEDLDNLYNGEKGNYKGNELYKGFFVNRDILYDFFSKLQIKVKSIDNDTIDYNSSLNNDIRFEYVR